jgi:diguanylate cyclase (GGDEF)-like protein
MDDAAAPPARLSDEDALHARNRELTSQLRAAAMEGDTLRVTRVLSELLCLKRLTAERKLALQALTHFIDSLRSVAMTDELTGVYNRRGFLQIGMRFLNVARRDLRSAYLVYFELNKLKQVNDTEGRTAGDVLIRQTCDFLRELFPSYGVYQVLGRLGGQEFAALTTDMKCPSRSEILLRARMPQARSSNIPALSLSVGLAYFNPLLPLGIDELLETAARAMYEHERLTPNRVVRGDLLHASRDVGGVGAADAVRSGGISGQDEAAGVA